MATHLCRDESRCPVCSPGARKPEPQVHSVEYRRDGTVKRVRYAPPAPERQGWADVETK